MPAISDFVALTKPRITLMVVLTTLFGYYVAAEGALDVVRLFDALLGTALSCAGAGALNMVMERRADGLMTRTRHRPIPSGRMSAGTGLAFGGILSSAGLIVLAAKVNAWTAALSAVTIALYLFVYTPLKSRTSLCTVIGAIPGALPPVMGWTAATGSLGAGAWALFGVLFFWQLPHFLAIAWLYREDYERAGYPVLPVVDPDGGSTARQVVLQTLALVVISLAPVGLGLAGGLYLAGAVALGLAFLAFGLAFALVRTRATARRLFLASLAYLPGLFALLAMGRIG
ncbi:MAG: protoheme IX farnesyltransferase [Planctomycetes bacterium]|nr:protoheme IX farnesyltransferase [Planctomycetota bacterium]